MGHLHRNEKTGAPQGHCVKCRVGMAEQQMLSGRKTHGRLDIGPTLCALFAAYAVCLRKYFCRLGIGNERMHPVAMCGVDDVGDSAGGDVIVEHI